LNTFILGQYDLVAKQDANGTSRFFVVGDWGGLPVSPFDTPSEVAVANAMGKLGVTLNTSFQLALGDNFYYDGVKTVDDPRFQVQFFSL
jgi:tartrate-resistant acid phosphatase type 5